MKQIALTRDEIFEALQRIRAWLSLFSREHLCLIWEALSQLVGRRTVLCSIQTPKTPFDKKISEDTEDTDKHTRPSCGDDGLTVPITPINDSRNDSVEDGKHEGDSFEFCEFCDQFCRAVCMHEITVCSIELTCSLAMSL